MANNNKRWQYIFFIEANNMQIIVIVANNKNGLIEANNNNEAYNINNGD